MSEDLRKQWQDIVGVGDTKNLAFGIVKRLEIWQNILPPLKPKRILEVGSFKGRSAASAVYIITQTNKEGEMHCIDTWKGGSEHQADGTAPADMNAVHKEFDERMQTALELAEKGNVKIEFFKHQGYSDEKLVHLLANGYKNYFDFIFIDGSHQADDVLCDAVLAYKLLRVGGILGFDDYLWSEPLKTGKDIARCPKMAIDAFTNIYWRKIDFQSTLNFQTYFKKMVD
ncbi:MAG: class I SAM-dependent methyltransferase [Alphaproteobacteria bacterium]|nr:class I SAM-dependent methyltransferase [Alphaproteobacteria bacterium]